MRGRAGEGPGFHLGGKGRRLQPRAKAFCQTAFTGSSRYRHGQSAGGCRAGECGQAQRRAALPGVRGEEKIKELKSGEHWVPSVCFRHRSCWRTSRLPARSSPAQPGEGETQVVIRSCSHPAPRAGALPKAPGARRSARSHPSGGERESPLASVAFNSSPVIVPGGSWNRRQLPREQPAANASAAASHRSRPARLRAGNSPAEGRVIGDPSPATYRRVYRCV